MHLHAMHRAGIRLKIIMVIEAWSIHLLLRCVCLLTLLVLRLSMNNNPNRMGGWKRVIRMILKGTFLIRLPKFFFDIILRERFLINNYNR